MSRIAIVDDNDDTREIVRIWLERDGYKIIEFDRAEPFVAELRNGAIDLALIDLQMPEMDGFGVAQIVRQDLQMLKLPMFAVTAFVVKDIQSTLLNAGYSEVITKPIDFNRMTELIKTHLTSEAAPFTQNG